MNSAICTLFEGHYHYGVAALTNSLYANGFRGKIYAGYRGNLPEWADASVIQPVGNWGEAHVLQIVDGLQLVFLPLVTDYHFTNYKPDFMLELLEGPAKDIDAVYYFDPDICVSEQWTFFEDWVSCGVALCEDVNSPLPENHPRRVGWRRYFAKYGFDLKFRAPEYVNGGFVGVPREHIRFLSLWRDIQCAMADEIGGLQKAAFKNSLMDEKKLISSYIFNRTDQDALNATNEAYKNALSIMCQEAMAFKHGPHIMSHALGQPKPWHDNLLIAVIKGMKQGKATSDYWRYCNTPIQSQGWLKLALVRLYLAMGKVTFRLYGHS